MVLLPGSGLIMVLKKKKKFLSHVVLAGYPELWAGM